MKIFNILTYLIVDQTVDMRHSLPNRPGTWLLIVCFIIIPSGVRPIDFAQATTPASKAAMSDELFQTISRFDKQVFDAIDRCDMKTESSFWTDDAEFYHDKNGLMAGGPQIVDAIKNNLCGKVKRELVPGMLEVYPLPGYGAVEIGVHRFLHPWEQDHGIVGRQSSFMPGATKMACGRSQE